MKILIKGGRVVDPANRLDEITDILIGEGKILKVSKDLKPEGAQVIEAAGRIVIPGLVDMHVHLRQPGREDKETIRTGTLAAAAGGVTSVLAMPNTDPVPDGKDNIALIRGLIKDSAVVNVFICGAITRGRLGRELADISGLKNEGAVAISDDGSSVDSDEIMQKALEEAKTQKILLICHSEDKALSANGVVNLGFTSTRLGLRGISRESEYKRVERDISLAEKAKAPVHIAHVSCRESVEIIAAAKKRGVMVTCETAPHYFALTEEAVLGYDPNFKMNPPLRGKDDVAAIKKGLKDGTIDCIASDHAPHTENEKDIEFDRAEFGVVGLETELGVTVTELVGSGVLSWPEAVRKLSLNPAKALNINKGTLSVGADADIAVIDPEREWLVKKEALVSKSKNSAFLGRRLKGAAVCTISAGKVVFG